MKENNMFGKLYNLFIMNNLDPQMLDYFRYKDGSEVLRDDEFFIKRYKNGFYVLIDIQENECIFRGKSANKFIEIIKEL